MSNKKKVNKEDKLNLRIWSRNGESLLKINADLKNNFKDKYNIVSSKTGDIFVMNHIHDYRSFIFHRKLLIQPLDGTVINSGITENINTFHQIITPSSVNKKQLEDCGVVKPIKVIPNYYDEDLLKKDNGFFDSIFNDKKYTFYTESTGIARKNITNALKYFLEEFTDEDNVRLLIKLNEIPKIKVEKFKKMLEKYPNRPEVIFLNKRLPKEYLHSLERGIDCYICLSHMEGFCIPLLNSIVLKKDVITLDTKISGYKDFVNKENSILLPTKEIDLLATPDNLFIYSKESKWEETDYKEYRKALRKVFKGEYKFKKDQDYSKYSQKNVMKEYSKVLDVLSKESIERGVKIKELAQRRYNEYFSKFRSDSDLNVNID